MNGMSAGFYAAIGRLGAGDTWTGLTMIDGSAGPARIMFEGPDHRVRSAEVARWLAIVRPAARGRRATRVMWLLDGSTVTWPYGGPPGELARGATGLDAEANPVLWFHASSGRAASAARARALGQSPRRGRRARARRALAVHRLAAAGCVRGARWARALARWLTARWAFTAPGVFGAAGIVDAATVRVSRRPLSSRTRLRITVCTQMWELTSDTPDTAIDGQVAWPRLTIAARGRARPLDLAAVNQWL
jgi:hypothetical protein